MMTMREADRILDVLGNRNRRAILTLLSQRPCYVSEIAELLDVGPKAVIDHLRMLEETGLVRNYVDEERRKNYQISDNIRLEVRLSPFIFGMDLHDLMVTAEERDGLRRELLSRQHGSPPELSYLEMEMRRLRRMQEELCDAQKSVQVLMDEAMRMCTETIGRMTRDQVEAEILLSLMRGRQNSMMLSRALSLPIEIMNDGLEMLAVRGLVKRSGELWNIV